MRYSYCNYYKCIDVVCDFFFRCVNSVSGLYLHPLRYVINVVCFLLCDLCFKLRGRTYTRILYAWFNAYRKEVNAKVRNYNLRNLDKEMNMKVLNLFMSGWQLAPLRE